MSRVSQYIKGKICLIIILLTTTNAWNSLPLRSLSSFNPVRCKGLLGLQAHSGDNLMSQNYLKDPDIPLEIKMALLRRESEKEVALLRIEAEKEATLLRYEAEKNRKREQMLMTLVYLLLVSVTVVQVGFSIRDGLIGSPAKALSSSVSSISESIKYSAFGIVTSAAVTTIKRLLQFFGKRF
jgi:hypothetical protein